jgi:pilus assembly protein CpaC
MSRRLQASNGDRLPLTSCLVSVILLAVSSMSAFGQRSSLTDSPLFSLSGTAAKEQSIHLVVGHLLFLNTKLRVSRVYIPNPLALDSYTAGPNQVVLTAKAIGLSSVVVWDENSQSQVYMVSSDMDVDDLRSSIKQRLPQETIEVEGREGRVILTGTVSSEAVSDDAVKLATLFTKDVANSLVVNPAKVKQVRLKVRIVEVDRSRLEQFGINIFNPGGGTTVGGGTTSQFPVTTSLSSGSGGGSGGTTVGGNTLSVSDPLNFLFYSSKLNLGVTVKDLESKNILQILAEPTITTLSGQKADFLAGGEFPFPVVQGSSGGLTSVTIQFRPYGVKLEFTPWVNVDGTIALKVSPEVSALDYANAVVISGYTIPALSTRRAETQVVLRDGQSFAISGLLDRRTTDSLGRTPGIASVPILGQLFKSKNVNLSTSELIVIVTPSIINPLTDKSTPEEPESVRPFMKPRSFDNSLPASLKKP